MKTVNVGVIGCGNISGIYLENCRTLFKDILRVTCVADTDPQRARDAAVRYGVPRYCSPGELLAYPDVEIVLNITPPSAHYPICLDTLKAGKHIYVEKPLSLTVSQGQELLNMAREKSLLIGCAPDTFMGAGLQACRRLLDQGRIGKPVAAAAFVANHGHEHWHPDPAAYYKKGAGPLFDMGPYYITALVNMLGPVNRVRGLSTAAFSRRVISSEPKAGQVIDVEVPTDICAVMDFSDGVTANLTATYDFWNSTLPFIEIYGTEGSLSMPDPNIFGGPVRVFEQKTGAWREEPVPSAFSENSRGLGLADLALAAQNPVMDAPRASGKLAFHVLEVMENILASSENLQVSGINSVCERPRRFEGFDAS